MFHRPVAGLHGGPSRLGATSLPAAAHKNIPASRIRGLELCAKAHPQSQTTQSTTTQPARHATAKPKTNIPRPPGLVQMEDAAPPMATAIPDRHVSSHPPSHAPPSLNPNPFSSRPRPLRKHLLGIPRPRHPRPPLQPQPLLFIPTTNPLATHRALPVLDTPRRRRRAAGLAPVAAAHARRAALAGRAAR